MEDLAFWAQFAPLILTFFIQPTYRIAKYLKGIHDKIESIFDDHEIHKDTLNAHHERIERLETHVAGNI